MKKTALIAGVGIVVVGLVFVVLGLGKKGVPSEDPSRQEASSVKEDPEKGKFDALFQNALELENKGELLAARDAFKSLLVSFVSRAGIEEVQKKLEGLNMRILQSAINVPGETEVYVVEPGDVLSMIADQYRTSVEFIKRQNGLKTDVIRPNQRLRIWTGRLSVLVDKSQNLLTLRSNGEVIKTFQVSTGKENITPVGNFKIINKLVDPAWTHEGKVYPSSSPENILGTRWLGFDVPGYGIHGTTQPESIGQQATAGCVRMLNREVEELYGLLPLGTEVTIMD